MAGVIGYDELAARVVDGSVVLLDAQAPGWYEREHFPGARWIDSDALLASVHAAVPDPTTPVLAYCWNSTCSGSAAAAEALEDLGYTTVRRYAGGREDWVAHGGPLDRNPS